MEPCSVSPFLTADTPLQASDAVAALLVLEDGRYILQLRDPLPHIWFPDHWGLFGGVIEDAETLEEALVRELCEELGFEVAPSDLVRLTSFDLDFRPFGQGMCRRTYFTVPITHAQMACFELGEGAAFDAFTAEEIFSRLRLTPYDSLAVWMHVARGRLAAPSP